MALGEITHGGFKVQEREEPQLQGSGESSEDPREPQLSAQLEPPQRSQCQSLGTECSASVLPQIPRRLLSGDHKGVSNSSHVITADCIHGDSMELRSCGTSGYISD